MRSGCLLMASRFGCVCSPAALCWGRQCRKHQAQSYGLLRCPCAAAALAKSLRLPRCGQVMGRKWAVMDLGHRWSTGTEGEPSQKRGTSQPHAGT
jgi:hypothetical protein